MRPFFYSYLMCYYLPRDIFAATESSTPSTMPKTAANKTWKPAGNKNVIVCAGYQNSGMVFLNTNPH